MIKYKNFEDASLDELRDERKQLQVRLNDGELGRSLKSIEAKIAGIESGSLSKEYNIGDHEVGFNALDTLEKMLENALTEVKNYRLDECHAREKREKYETLARNIASAIECVKKLDQD